MSLPLRFALLDFDGTLVTKDILDLLCRAVGEEEESKQLNAQFHAGELPGLLGLISRVNILKGLTKQDIFKIIEPETFLMPGTLELFEYFRQHNITTILASGNIEPVLEFYQKILGIDYIVGSKPYMSGDAIVGIDEAAYSSKSFKIDGIQSILAQHPTEKKNIVALGDSPSDIGMFGLSGLAIAVNPKGNLAEYADFVVGKNLNEAVRILEVEFVG